jgi:hypothetical protein
VRATSGLFERWISFVIEEAGKLRKKLIRSPIIEKNLVHAGTLYEPNLRHKGPESSPVGSDH